MGHHDEDDDEFGGGPPPDPSMRAWRHPSEIAAAAAAAKRDAAARAEPEPPAAWPLWLRSNVTAVAAMTAFVALAAAAGVSLTTLDPQAEITLTAESGAGKLGPSIDLQSASVSTTTADVTELTSPSALPEANSEAAAETEAEEVPSQNEIDTRPDAGVYSSPDGDGAKERLGAFVVVSDMLFTSSSATLGHEEIELRLDGLTIEARIVARDPLNDLALIEVDPAAQAGLEGAATSTCQMADGAAMGSSIMVMDGESDRLRLEQGVVIGTDEPIVSSSGDRIFGSLLTTARRPDGTAGSALVDHEGCVMGVVVDTPDYLAAAVPIDRVIAFGESYEQWGLPSIEWLGLTGSNAPEGGVVIDEVTADGPAAQASLLPGDHLVSVGDQELIDWDQLTYLVREAGVGQSIELTVVRNDIPMPATITIGLLPVANN